MKIVGCKTYKGQLCKRGHTTRYVSNGACVECCKIVAKERWLREKQLLAKIREQRRGL